RVTPRWTVHRDIVELRERPQNLILRGWAMTVDQRNHVDVDRWTRQLMACAGDVGNLSGHVARQLPLNREIPLLRISVSMIRLNEFRSSCRLLADRNGAECCRVRDG